MKLLGRTKNKITKDKNGENRPQLWLTDQNSKPLETEDKINKSVKYKT